MAIAGSEECGTLHLNYLGASDLELAAKFAIELPKAFVGGICDTNMVREFFLFENRRDNSLDGKVGKSRYLWREVEVRGAIAADAGNGDEVFSDSVVFS